jgi:hypothetical protein
MAYRRISSFGSNDSGYESGIMEVFDEPPRPAVNNRDFTRDIARQRQNMLAEELSRLDAEEYQHDMLEHMLHMDVRSAPTISTPRHS